MTIKVSRVIEDSRPMIDICVHRIIGEDEYSDEFVTAKGLIDTGCTMTCISQKLVKKLKIPKNGDKTTLIQTPKKNYVSQRYSVVIHIEGDGEDNADFYCHNAIAFPDDAISDVLIGMDIIALANEFSIRNDTFMLRWGE